MKEIYLRQDAASIAAMQKASLGTHSTTGLRVTHGLIGRPLTAAR
jgi:hypothetical protein